MAVVALNVDWYAWQLVVYALWVPSVGEYVGGVLVVFGSFGKCLFDGVVGPVVVVVVGRVVSVVVGCGVQCVCE